MAEQQNSTLASETVPTKRWYVVQVYVGHEKKVKLALEERVRINGLDDKFGEILIPTEQVMVMQAGKKLKSEQKFFPGYVLVSMALTDITWHLVRETPKVLGFIGKVGGKPMPISDKEAESIQQRVKQGVDKPRPKVLYEPGEVVHVVDGPFANFDGVVQEVNYEKSRLKVAVLILGRSTPVDLQFGQVEKA